MSNELGVYTPLHVDLREGVVISGYRKPTEEDYEHLEISRGSSKVDMDQLMAMPPRDTHLWRYLHGALQTYHDDPTYVWFPQYQKYGTCVGQASKLAVDILMAINCVLYGMEFQGRAAVAGSYTFSRVEIGREPGKWEGSNGVNAAAGLLKYGVLLLKDIGLSDDATDADENLAMKWTATSEGVPANFEKMAANLVVEDVIQPTSIKMAGKLIQAGSPQFVGTSYIPTGKRDSRGVSPIQRIRGGHEMCVDAVMWGPDGMPTFFHIQNSWSVNWATGAMVPNDMPKGGVWITAADYWKMIMDGDISSIIGVNGLNYKG